MAEGTTGGFRLAAFGMAGSLKPEDRPDYARVKREVSRLLQQFGVTEPPVDPVTIARGLGVEVFFAEFSGESQNISGFYDCEENAVYVNSEEYPLRQTFTVAHELGHKILHEEWARFADYRMLMRDQLFVGNDPREKEANAFAGHLLVPRHFLDRYWNVATLEQMSLIFAVSVPVIKNRLSLEYGIRDTAKQSIVTRGKKDPELDNTLAAASQGKLDLARETNRHAETMRGALARVFGPRETAPTFIAFVAMVFGLGVFAICLFQASGAPPAEFEFWNRWAERSLAFASTALAFIFGKGFKS